jgi:hypothetical protein
MAWHYEPPAPETEAEVTLSEYHARERIAELRARAEIEIDAEAPVHRSNLERLRNAGRRLLRRGS